MSETVVAVTKKGQAAIPKKLGEKHRIGKKAIAVDRNKGVLLKPMPDPVAETGSLSELFTGRTSKGLVEEARLEEVRKEKRSLKGGMTRS